MSLVALFFLSGVGWLLALTPRSILCLTPENTYCPEEWLEPLAPLKKTSFWRLASPQPELLQSVKDAHPEITSLSIKPTLSLQAKVLVGQSRVVFPLSIEGTTYLVRENGLLTRKDMEDALIPELARSEQKKNDTLDTTIWPTDVLQNVETLLQATRHLTPRIKKIVLIDRFTVQLYPDGSGPILVRVDSAPDIPEQLSTLQAFFRSSTMERTYQELDVRFATLVIRE